MANRLASRWQRFQAAFFGLTAGALLAAAATPAHAFSWGFDNNGVPLPLNGYPARESCIVTQPTDVFTLSQFSTYNESTYSSTCFTMPNTGFFIGDGSTTVTDVDVSLKIRHPRIKDLVIMLRHVDAARIVDVPLLVAAGCEANDFPADSTFGQDISIYLDDDAQASVDFACDRTIPEIHGRLQPTSARIYTQRPGLDLFNGMAAAGEWTLEIQDYGPTGSRAALVEWQLHVNGLVEGDLAPREEAPTAPNTQSGNNIVTETDYVVAAYHLLGIDEFDNRVISEQRDNLAFDSTGARRPSADYIDTRRSSGAEFTRADSAPASSNGDGIFSVADFVQTSRYAASADTLVPAAKGPLSKDDRMLFAYPSEGATLVRGEPRDIPVSVMMRSKQAETEVGFGLNFDPELLEFVRVERGSCVPANAIFQVSREVEQPGLVGVRVGVDPDSTFVCDFGADRPLLGTGDPASPASVGTTATESALAFTPTLRSVFRTIDFSGAFPEVAVDFYLEGNDLTVLDYRFDINISEDKLVILGSDGADFGSAPTIDFVTSGSNLESVTSTYSVEAINPGSSFVNGKIGTIFFQILPGENLLNGGVYRTSFSMPSVRIVQPAVSRTVGPDGVPAYGRGVLNRVLGNPVVAQFYEPIFDFSDTLEIRSGVDNPAYGRVGTPPTTVNMIPVIPADMTTSSTCALGAAVAMDIRVANNVRSPGVYTLEVQYDPTKYIFPVPNPYVDGGYSGSPTRMYQTDITPTRRLVGIKATEAPLDTFLNGTLLRLQFTTTRVLSEAEDNSIKLTKIAFEISDNPLLKPVLQKNTVNVCPGLSKSASESRIAEAGDEPAAEAVASKSVGKGIPPDPVVDARLTARLIDVAATPSGKAVATVGFEVAGNNPALPITNYSFELSYDHTVTSPKCDQILEGGDGFGALPTMVYTDDTNEISPADDCFVNSSIVADPFRALPNLPSSNYRTLRVDGRSASSTLLTGTLFTMTFAVDNVADSRILFHLKSNVAMNRNVEIARVYFRAKEGTGTVATPLVFGPNVFADGLAARNPLGSPIYMSFIDSGLTIVDPSLPRSTVRIVDTVLKSNTEGTVQIALDSAGIETAAGFTLSYNPADIQLISASRGRDVHPSGFFYTEPNENSVAQANATGKLRMLISLQPGAAPGPAQTFQQGTRILANLRFKTREFTPAEADERAVTTFLRFEKLADKREVCDAFAIPLDTRFPEGTVSISSEDCNYVIAPLAREYGVNGTLADAADEELTLDVLTGCPWVASTTADWITLNPATISGIGSGKIKYRVAENTGPARSAQIEVGGQIHTITQLACAYSLDIASDTFPGEESFGSFTVQTSSICDWRVETANTWIQITSPRFVIGGGQVTYKVDANVGLPRTGTITVRGGGGQVLTFTVNQVICAYALVPTNSPAIPATGGSGTIKLTTDAACPWVATVESGANWITITANGSGRGSTAEDKPIAYTVAPITTRAGRSASITIGDQVFVITQTGCRYDLAGTAELLPAGPNQVEGILVTDPACVWAASLDQAWATIIGEVVGAGSHTFPINLTANTSGAVRRVILSVEGSTTTFSQDFCTYTLNPSKVDLEPAAANGTIGLSVNNGGCPWTVTVDQPWVTITSVIDGSGNSNINYRVTANTTGETRVANIRVNNQTAVLTQTSCGYEISPLEAFVPSVGGIANFEIKTEAGCPWSVTSGASWVTVLNPTGEGTQTVALQVAPNFDESREAQVSIGNKTFMVRQFKRNQFGFDFGNDQNGWEYSGVGGFTTPTGAQGDGALNITLADNKNSFGFWRSPLLTLDDAAGANSVYLLTATVKTNLEEQSMVPPLRFRVSSSDFSQTNELWALSNGSGTFSPSAANPRNYRHLFTLPEGSRQFRVYFDVLGLVTTDSANATLSLDQVIVQTSPYALDTPKPERLFLLADSATGWTNGGSPDFTVPTFGTSTRGLTVAATDTNNVPTRTIFGFWNNNSSVTLTAPRAYLATFRVSARSIRGPEVQKTLVPPFRLRLNTSSFRAASVVNVDSRNQNSRIPTFLTPEEYKVWIVSEAELAGDRLFFAFDYLLPAGSQDDPAVELTLEKVEVVSYSVPAAN